MAKKKKKSTGSGLKKFRNFVKKKTKSQDKIIRRLESKLGQVKRKKAAKVKQATRMYRKKFMC